MNDLKEEVLNVINNLKPDFFLIDWQNQKEVYSVDCVESKVENCALNIRIRTDFGFDEIIYLRCYYDTLECGVLNSELYSNHALDFAYMCAKKLENLLKKVIIDGTYIKINNKYI